MKRKNKPEKPEEPKAIVVTDLGQLETICGEPFIVSLTIRGKPVEISGARLRPEQAAEVKLIAERAMPPLRPSKEPGKEPEYDFSDPDYQREAEKSRRQARAVALWRGYKIFRDKAAEASLEPKGAEEMMKFIEGRAIEDDALELLFQALTRRWVEEAAYVGFTSGSSSQKS